MSPEVVLAWCLVVATVAGIVVLTCYVLLEERGHVHRWSGVATADPVSLDSPTSPCRGPEDDPAWLAYSREDPGGNL